MFNNKMEMSKKREPLKVVEHKFVDPVCLQGGQILK